jgi:hypothetical protein
LDQVASRRFLLYCSALLVFPQQIRPGDLVVFFLLEYLRFAIS